jgi:hypothetical protein
VDRGKAIRDALGNDLGKGSGASRCTTSQGWKTHLHWAHVAAAITRDAMGLGHPVTGCLAGTGRRDGGWVGSTFQMAEDLADHCALCDDGDEPQCPALTKRAVCHIQRKDPMQQPRPVPLETGKAGVMLVAPWTAILTTCAWRSLLGVPAAPCASSA